ncbi:MAG: class I SAM-dependent methyltransferase [Chloroflexota bacterium]
MKFIRQLKAHLANRKLALSEVGGSQFAIRDAYDRWAASYPPTAHNPVMRVEQAAMVVLLPDVRGARALDLACGTGRYANVLRERGAASVVALDFSAEMLARASFDGLRMQPICATMMQLPLAAESFDVIVSGLAVGHADDLRAWMRETARVLRRGGTLLYSDFHPAAANVGLKRSFRTDDGRTITVPHHTFTLDDHRNAARAAGLTIEALHELRVGVELTEAFDGSTEFYRRRHGTPIVLAAKLIKESGTQVYK